MTHSHSSDTCLITGASGFVGAAVLRRVLAAGLPVRALVRPNSVLTNLQDLPVDIVHGDLQDPESLQRAVAGCAYVFHVAADYRLWALDPAELYRSNVDGTVNLLRAAGDAGVKRMVYTSSVAVLKPYTDGTPADETTPTTEADMIGDYKRSKYLAELAVIKLVREHGLPVVIVNPSTPVGPRDIKPTPTGRTIRDAALGNMPAYVDTGLNIVHVDDVAEGHWLAFAKGEIGERYILGGEDMSLREILAYIAKITGRAPPKIQLPLAAVLPIAYVSEFWARITRGNEPRATVSGVLMAKKKMFFSSEKARRLLGYKPRSAQDALRDAVNYFLAAR
jgi:dihydroflavonol-4-reductase